MSNPHRPRLVEPQSVSPPPVGGLTGVAMGSGPHRAGTLSNQSQIACAQVGTRKHCPVCGERYPADFRVCPRDATALDTLRGDNDPIVGAVLADTYDVLRVIGEGATGRVYEARHIRLPAKRYAIKVMYSDLTRQPAVVERFLREAEATSVLSHPNIVSAMDVGQTQDGCPFIVSELLEGIQFGDYLARKGQLSVPEAVHLVRQASQALIAAHDKGIVHRDIKPANLYLVGEAGAYTVKVLDFGISLIGDASLTKTGMVMGTPAYMPPEQASGTRVDHRADIYALATVMYEALTGTKAFTGADPIATLANVLTRDPPRPRSMNSAIPPELELVIQKAMSKLPSQRYRSMRELDAALACFDVGPTATLDAADIEEGLKAAAQEWGAEQAGEESSDGGFSLGGYAYAGWRSNFQLPSPLARLLGAGELDPTRAQLVGFAWASGVTLLLGLIGATTSAIRFTRGEAPLTGTELVLSTVGSLGLLIMPTWVFAHHISKRVWSSTPRVVDVTRRMRRVLFAGLVTYAAGTLLLRVFASVLANESGGVASSGWDLLMFGAAAVVGARVGWRELRRGEWE